MISAELRIGDEWRTGAAHLESTDPFTQAPWARAPETGQDDVDDAVRAARQACDHGPWPPTVWFETEGATRDPFTVG